MEILLIGVVLILMSIPLLSYLAAQLFKARAELNEERKKKQG